MNDEGRDRIIAMTYEIQDRLEKASLKLDSLRRYHVSSTSDQYASAVITQIAEISNEIMRLRQIVQPS